MLTRPVHRGRDFEMISCLPSSRTTPHRRLCAGRASSVVPRYSLRCPNGTYRRNDAKSELKSYSRILGLLRLNALASYTAAKLIEGVTITINEGRTRADVEYLSVVPFFDVKETYALDGMTRTKNSRRDMEAGMSTCTATLVNDVEDASAGESYVLKIRMSWDEPNRGGLVEEMHVATTGELVVMSTVQVRDGTATCRTVYDKVGEGGLRFNARWNPLDAVRIMRGGKV